MIAHQKGLQPLHCTVSFPLSGEGRRYFASIEYIEANVFDEGVF